LPGRTGQKCKRLAPEFVQAKDAKMRDFRDAKAMAHTLRAALAAKGLKITVSESLELIATAFGAADWNTLSATIGALAARETSPPAPSSVQRSVARRVFLSAPLRLGG
jgi:hypothetical protein